MVHRPSLVTPPYLGALPPLVPQPSPRMVTPEVTTVLNATTPGNATQLNPAGSGAGVLEVISPLSLAGTAIPRGRIYAQAWVVDSLGNRLFTVWSGYLVTAGGTPAGPASVPGIPIDPSWSIIAVATQTGQGAATRVGFAALISPGSSARAGSPGYVHSEDPGSGIGEIRVVNTTQPAAGANSTETVPAKCRWRCGVWRASLVTDANVANRNLLFQVDDGATTLNNIQPNLTQTAGQAVSYDLFAAAPDRSAVVNSTLHTPMVDAIAHAGWRFKTNVNNIQVGDQLSGIRMGIEEWAVP